MIRAVMVMNTQGKPRLAKFYKFMPVEKQQELIRSVFGVLCSRAENVSNFVEADSIFGPHTFNLKDGLQSLPISFEVDLSVSTEPYYLDGSFSPPYIQVQNTRLVYKHYATLYFVFVFDSSENELAMLDLIQVFVETLDKCFRNVCELDIVFNFSKMHIVLNEIILGGQVLETSSTKVMKVVEEMTRLEKASNSISLVPKSVSSWQK